MVEFKSFGKIPRDNPFSATITEKIDGTNACIIIEDGKLVGTQSRKRLITPDDDNYGFAAWAAANEEDLLGLGDGYHFGEWAGLGIQKNPHNLKEKEFFLFNTYRWSKNPERPKCCNCVPVLFQGLLEVDTIEKELGKLAEKETDLYKPEGIIVYYHAFDKYTKHTIKSPNGKWCK